MSLIAQQIANLLNGVSQRPQEQRHSSQAELQRNGLSHLVRGLMKRPPLVYLGKLTAVTTGWATAFVHSVNRDENERYHVVVANGDIFVYDAITPAALTVLAPKGKAYLTDSSKGYRAATAGDTTMIVNRAVTVKQGAKKTTPLNYEALVYVRQADYATTYQVLLNDISVGIRTVAQSSPSSRESISTDKIAADLYAALTQEVHLGAFTFTLYGSTIYIVRTTDFAISTVDGLSDKGLKAVKGSVQDFADLPRKASNGFTVKIAGDPESTKDDYWVKYDDKGNPKQAGVWRECPAPGTPVKLDEFTMPHRLVRYGTVLEKVAYEGRVGSDAIFADAPSGPTLLSWAFLTPSNTAITPGTTPELRDHGTGVKLTLAQNAKRLYAPYRIDTSLVEPGNDVTVTLYKNSVSLSSRVHPAGYGVFVPPPGMFLPPPMPGQPTYSSGLFDLSQAFANTDIIELKITYAKGVTPDQYRRTTMSPQQPTIFVNPARELRFSTEQDYPVGTVVTAVIDGKPPFVYTVAGSPATGATVASGLAPIIDADSTLIATASANVITVSNTGGTYPVVSSVTAVLSTTTIFQNSSLTMTVNEHVGRTLKNLTDGSSGTVTANTAKTITVGSLTGGVDNQFKPGDLVSVVGTGRYFVFEPCPWNERGAGDLDVVPFPSFKDNTISDVVFYLNRLGFTANENVVFSAAGDLFNFFRQTATQLLPDDVIDVRAAHKEVALFHSFVLWNEGLYAVSDNGQWVISGEPFTPTTIRIDIVSRIPNTPGPRPVVNGNMMYVTRGKGGFSQVSEFFVTPDSSKVVDAINITEDIPKYIKGKPLVMVGDDTLGIIALLTDADGQKNVYIYSYRFDENDRSRIQSSWSKWETSSGQIVGLDMIDGKLGVVTVHSDGAYLHTIDLNVTLDVAVADEGALYLDRQVTNLTAGVSAAYSSGPNTTTWTLPFNVATDGSEGTLVVVKRNPTTLLTTTRPAANQIRVTGQGDLTAASVYIGVLYEYRYKFSRIYFRNKDQVPETRAHLTLRYLDVFYHDTTDFDVVVTIVGRNPFTYSTLFALPTSGKRRVPVGSKTENVIIELVSNSPGVCAFSMLDWEGDFTMNDRRV